MSLLSLKFTGLVSGSVCLERILMFVSVYILVCVIHWVSLCILGLGRLVRVKFELKI